MKRIADSFPQHTPARPSVPCIEVHADAYKDKGQAVSTGETAFCHVCGSRTPTVLMPLGSGHVANACEVCRACRKGRPFATRREYEQWKANAHEGRGLRNEQA